MFFRALPWTILVAVVLWSPPTLASVPSASEVSDAPYHIRADTLDYDDTLKMYRARGHVVVVRGDRSLRADAIDLNTETMEAVAWGDVNFTSGEDWLTGTRLEMNLNEEVGTLYNGILFIEQTHFYVHGKQIKKTGKDSYYIDDGRFTACDGDHPDWKITGRDLRVTIDGYGTIKHATFWAKSAPLAYAPFLFFPAKIERQTGLLFPQASLSDRDGFTYIQPFFWAINEASDVTLYETYMDRRGFKHGAEYRYALAPQSKGTMMYDYLRDRQIDDGTVPEDSSGYHYEGFTGDDEVRLNRDRWWFRMKSDQDLPGSFKAKLDMDLVSDQDYLREFRRGYSGFDSNDTYFSREFGRDLDDYTDTVRLNLLSLNRNWDQYSLTTDFRWYDNVIVRKNDDPDPTLQRLPHVQFDGSKQELLQSPFYFDLESSYDYFWRDYGTKGHRADFHPRAYYPVRLFRYFDFEPSIGVRETLWQVEEYENETRESDDRFFSREVVDLRADLSTEFWKTFSMNWKNVDKIRHSVRPQIVYDYVPVPDQDEYPDFEGIDRLKEKNLVTYSVTNYFTARSIAHHEGPETQAGSSGEIEVPSYKYRDFSRIKLTQSYDIEEARRDTAGDTRRPFSDIKGEIEFLPYPCLDLDGDVTWSPYDSEFTGYNAILAVCDERGDRLSVDYRYTRDRKESILSKALVKLFHPVSVYGSHERNIRDGKDVETIIGFTYAPQCWSLNFTFTDDRAMDEQEYFVEIGLYGLGEIGL